MNKIERCILNVQIYYEIFGLNCAKEAYEQYLKEGGELSFDDIIKNVKRGPR
jgi:hypothetical protein